MTKFGDWMEEQASRQDTDGSLRMFRDLADLTAQLYGELEKMRNPGNPHLRESDHAGEGGCPQDCLDFRAALKACRKFQEKYQ